MTDWKQRKRGACSRLSERTGLSGKRVCREGAGQRNLRLTADSAVPIGHTNTETSHPACYRQHLAVPESRQVAILPLPLRTSEIYCSWPWPYRACALAYSRHACPPALVALLLLMVVFIDKFKRKHHTNVPYTHTLCSFFSSIIHKAYNTIRYSTASYNEHTIRYDTVSTVSIQYNTAQLHTTSIQYDTIQYSQHTIQQDHTTSIQYDTIQYSIIQRAPEGEAVDQTTLT